MKNGILLAIFLLSSVCAVGQTDTIKPARIPGPIICVFPVMPDLIYPGGLRAYLKDSIKYPAEEKKNGIQGTVYVRFVIEKDGSVTNVKEAKGVPGGPGLTKEVIRVFESMPKWKGVLENGEVVRYEMTQPVRFRLDDKDEPILEGSYIIKDDSLYELERIYYIKADSAKYPGFVTYTSEMKFVDSIPQFPGGSDKFMRYLAANIKYPQMEKENNVQGTVVLSFIVEPSGKITNVEVVKAVEKGPGLTKEAVRVVFTMPNWKPGLKEGKAVRTKVYHAVRFRLN
jgi:TonB family protein